MDVAAKTCFKDCRRESFTASPCYCATMSGGVERLADTCEKTRRAGATAGAAQHQRRISGSGEVLPGGQRCLPLGSERSLLLDCDEPGGDDRSLRSTAAPPGRWGRR